MIIPLIVSLLLLQTPPVPIPTFPAPPSPTLLPTGEPIIIATVQVPESDIYNYLATAERNLASAPDDIANPGGSPLLPNQSGSGVIGYAKWLFSSASGDEVFGPFGAVAGHLAVRFALVIFLAIIYFLVFNVRFVLRFVSWLITKIAEILPF